MNDIQGESRHVNFFMNVNKLKDSFVCEFVYVNESCKERAVLTTDNILNFIDFLENDPKYKKWLWLNVHYRCVTDSNVLAFGQIAAFTKSKRPTSQRPYLSDILRYIGTLANVASKENTMKAVKYYIIKEDIDINAAEQKYLKSI